VIAKGAFMPSSTLGLAAIVTAAVACSVNPTTDGADTLEQTLGESHPYQSRLVCDRAPGSQLIGRMYDVSSGTRVKISEFTSTGNVGACELAIRASRNNKVCVESGWSGYTIHDIGTNTNQGTYSTLDACTTITRGSPVMRTDPGYVDFIAPAELLPFKNALPTLADAALDQAMKSPRTMWNDESSLTFSYQDSFGDPKGLRANRVGYDVGINTPDVPDIFALTEYFEFGKFKFPFSLVAGSTFTDNVYALYFWLPPTTATGAVQPVRIWQNNSHWQWVFPVGTIIGEALYVQAPDDKKWFTFEVRTRSRALNGWTTNIFRPYLHASDLSAAIKAKRAAWSTTPDVKALVDHVDSAQALTANTLTAPSYAAIFPPLHGAMDYLPDTTDTGLIKELLTGRTFENAMGSSWKTEGALTAYAASTHASFHIVPREYPAGMFETSEASCLRCHEQTSRPLNNLDQRIVLYGEVWGEDQIFTWHPFAIDVDTFSVADGNRHVNQRLVTAGLVEMSTPASAPQIYKALPKPYVATYE
jgi:hypothetical protein